MNQGVKLVESEIGRTITDKRGLAERYMVGVRTIEEWQAPESSTARARANGFFSMSKSATAGCGNSKIRKNL